MNIEEVKQYIKNESLSSKIYLGCDSETRYVKNQWYIHYYLVVVIHHNRCNGCKVFGEKIVEKDYIADKRKPTYRLMQEVFKVSDLYLKLEDSFGERDVEVHLDLNPSKRYISNLIVDQAIGYVKGTCNVIPLIKPDSWAASCVADKFLKIA
jgi:predicted RNase H-related nuclease YkuK (DUF458 family)